MSAAPSALSFEIVAKCSVSEYPFPSSHSLAYDFD